VAPIKRSSPKDDLTPLSPLIHGRARLLILSFLMPRTAGATFTEIKAEVGLTDGTLSVHLSELEKGGLVEITKRFVGKRPQTVVTVSESGRLQFAAYLEELKRIVPGLA
jgi:DNA-binding transcriptional ArsR family regulator